MMLAWRGLWILLFTVVCMRSPNAYAIVINGDDGSVNIEAPADDFGFSNVGILNAGSGVYLGNRWVITASHVGPGTITLNGVEYDNVVDETVRLTNENVGSGLTPSTDLLLMRLEEDPGLPALRLGCGSVSVNSDVFLVGGGRDRSSERSFWFREDIAGEKNDIWTLVGDEDDANEIGYFTTASRTVRWGTSRVTANNFEADSGSGDVSSFQTDFFEPGPIIEESAQAVRGDSGGGIFQNNGGIWELVGVIHAVGLKENQPLRTDTAIFGGSSFHAELFDYADQIRSIADFEPAVGDFDGDGEITSEEIDRLFDAINRTRSPSCHFDLTGNGTVTHADFDQLLIAAESIVGDANLDGDVGFDDFLLMARSFGEENVGWARGDFDGDNAVTFGDFLLLSRNFGESFAGSSLEASSSAEVSAVPEPHAGWLLLVGTTGIWLLCGRRRRANS